MYFGLFRSFSCSSLGPHFRNSSYPFSAHDSWLSISMRPLSELEWLLITTALRLKACLAIDIN